MTIAVVIEQVVHHVTDHLRLILQVVDQPVHRETAFNLINVSVTKPRNGPDRKDTLERRKEIGIESERTHKVYDSINFKKWYARYILCSSYTSRCGKSHRMLTKAGSTCTKFSYLRAYRLPLFEDDLF